MATGGTAIGTGGYAPPEQYQGFADARSDVYGLAATLHHLLTGRDPTRQPPFVFPPVRSLVPTVSAQVETALLRALSIAPDDRFPTASAFATALRTEALARDLGVAICTVNSRDVAYAGDLATILTSVQAGDIVYMDDVNALVPAMRSMLREAMVEYAVDFGMSMGSRAHTRRMTCQRFTLVGGVLSRRALTSEAASYFAERIDARSLDSAWTAAVARVLAGATTCTSVEPTTQERGEMWAADDGEAENEDRLLAEAGKVVREYQRASVSLLQRRLSNGYSRAARLLDQLEKRGIVGPSISDVDEVERLLRKMMTVNPCVTAFVPVRGPDGQIDRSKVEAAVGFGFRLIRWHLDRPPAHQPGRGGRDHEERERR